MIEEPTVIHDFSRLDAFMKARRRSMLMHAAWRPMLAGAIGAVIVVGAVWAASPKLRFNEIEVPRITLKDFEVPRVVLRDVAVDHIVQPDVVVDRVVQRDAADHAPAAGGPYEPSGPAPVAPAPSSPTSSSSSSSTPSSQPAAAPMPAAPAASNPSPAEPKTPAEQKFTETPTYKNAPLSGRIVASRDGRALSFEDGRDFWPAHLDDATRKAVDDLDDAVDSEPYVGDLGFCRPQQRNAELWDCFALHDGQQVEIPNRPSRPAVPQKSASASQSPSGSSLPAVASDNGMIFAQVDLGGGVSVNAMVDSGASWGMAIPSALADKLVAKTLATRRPRPKGKTTFADGVAHEVGVISIKRITVNGRMLENVEAAVVPNRAAPVLLGLGALNRLGAFSIENGKLVFTAAARAG